MTYTEAIIYVEEQFKYGLISERELTVTKNIIDQIVSNTHWTKIEERLEYFINN